MFDHKQFINNYAALLLQGHDCYSLFSMVISKVFLLYFPPTTVFRNEDEMFLKKSIDDTVTGQQSEIHSDNLYSGTIFVLSGESPFSH